jgi:hypothetical protein
MTTSPDESVVAERIGQRSPVALIAAVLAWFGLCSQLYIILAARLANGVSLIGGVINFLSFFTVLTNILAALALTLPWVSEASRAGRLFAQPTVNTGIAASIACVGIAYNLLLRHLWQPQGLQWLADELLHDVTPLLFLLYWWRFVPKGLLGWRDVGRWALYPALYVFYALMRGALFGPYPYPFIDVDALGYARVFLNVGGLLIVFVGISRVLVTLDRVKRQSTLGQDAGRIG